MADGRKRIVMTGATGLIGRKLAARLIERGDEVILLGRNIESLRRAVPDAGDYLPWSGTMTDGPWAAAIDGAYGVINLAGAPVASRWSEEQKKRIYDSRVLGTRNIVNAIAGASHKPVVLVNGSAVGYYGTSEKELFTERSGAGDDFLAKICLEWEEEAKRGEESGVRVVLLRTGIVLDPDGGALGKLLPTFRLFLGGTLGNGKQWFPWIHRDDELEMILWALDNEKVNGAINGVAPGIVTNKEFSDVLGEVLHRPAIFPVPAFALKLVFGDGAAALTEGQHVVAERARQLGYRFLHPELRDALRDLLKE